MIDCQYKQRWFQLTVYFLSKNLLLLDLFKIQLLTCSHQNKFLKFSESKGKFRGLFLETHLEHFYLLLKPLSSACVISKTLKWYIFGLVLKSWSENLMLFIKFFHYKRNFTIYNHLNTDCVYYYIFSSLLKIDPV